MGHNPGGNGFITIGDHIDRMLTRTENSFLDESWGNGNSTWPAGQAPLQRRVIWLLESLNQNPRDVCASNLIFQTSNAAEGVSFGLAGICWPVHEAIIEIIRPKLLIVFGNGKPNSPYAFLRELFPGKDEHEFEAGHGDWKCRGFFTEINGVPLYVAGLPHLSKFDPTKNLKIITWLKSKLS